MKGLVSWTETNTYELNRLTVASRTDDHLRAVMEGPDWRPPELIVVATVIDTAYQQEVISAIHCESSERTYTERTESGWKLLVVRQDNNKVVEIDASRVERWSP